MGDSQLWLQNHTRQGAGERHAKDKGRFWHLKDLLLNESAVSETWVGKALQKTQIGHLLLPDANSLAKARNQSTGRHARQVRKTQTEQMRAWEYSKKNGLRNRGWCLDVLHYWGDISCVRTWQALKDFHDVVLPYGQPTSPYFFLSFIFIHIFVQYSKYNYVPSS